MNSKSVINSKKHQNKDSKDYSVCFLCSNEHAKLGLKESLGVKFKDGICT